MTTDTYRKYRYLAEVFEKSAALSIAFVGGWVFFTLTIAVVIIGGHHLLTITPSALVLLGVVILNVWANQDQTDYTFLEAECASRAFLQISEGHETIFFREILSKIALAAMEADRGKRDIEAHDLNFRFTILLSITRAAGHKVGKRKDYFQKK